YMYIQTLKQYSFPTRRSSDLGIPNPSYSEGYANTRADAYSSGRSESATYPAKRAQSQPFSAASRCVGSVPQMSRPTNSSPRFRRSEEHTSELQSRVDLVCRLL